MLPAALLAARFGEELTQRKRDLDADIKSALRDGAIDDDEHLALLKIADKLELQPEDLENSIRLLKKHHHLKHCPHCHKNL